MNHPLLDVRNLSVRFRTQGAPVIAVDNVSFSVAQGEVLGVVGESGSGKSQTFMALGGLLAANGETSGQALLDGQNLLTLTDRELDKVRGQKISYIFQDPMTALNPFRSVSDQMTELLWLHRGLDRAQAQAEALRLLERVRVPDARRRLKAYPHELSGGMRQRVMIAMALSNRPRLLIADEPTTALDVTVQIQVLDILDELRRQENLAVVLITHDMGVVARLAHRVMVVYAGTIAEEGNVDDVLMRPTHPYTAGLLDSMPDLAGPLAQLKPIRGHPPEGQKARTGCMFEPRCFKAQPICKDSVPNLRPRTGRQRQACHFPLETHDIEPIGARS